MSSRLVALDKMPGVRPLGCGEVWRRGSAKCVLAVAGHEAKTECGKDQLCAGLEAGIDGGIHAMRRLWDENEGNDEWGFLLVDARNAFNEINRTAALWTVRHRWPSGARFTFNCYKYHATLLVRSKDGGDAIFIYSKEGWTQGDPIAMIVYGIVMLPVTKSIIATVPECHQPWYADDAGAGGKFNDIMRYFTTLCDKGPARGYFPEPTKSIIIVKPQSVEAAKAKFAHLGFKVVTGARYLGGHVGTVESKEKWVSDKVKTWTEAVRSLSRVAQSSPQAAFAGLQKSLQSEWIHLQRVTDGIQDSFAPIEDAISSTFLPALLNAPPDQPTSLRDLLALPVKYGGIGLVNPTTTAERHHHRSTTCTSVLADAIISNNDEWVYLDHHRTLKEMKRLGIQTANDDHQSELDRLCAPMTPKCLRSTIRSQSTGAWLSLTPSAINGLTLSSGEFRDGIALRYGLDITDLPKKCDGCDAKFTKLHALQCKKGALVMGRHDDVKDEVAYLAALATNAGSVRDEPIINIGRATPSGLPAHASISSTNNVGPASTHLPPNPPSQDRGDILIRSLFGKSTDCVIDVRVTDSDAPAKVKIDPMQVLRTQEKEKKKKYLDRCIEQRRHFAPYVVDCYGLLGKEARAVNKKLAAKLESKWRTPYSVTCGFVNARISIAILRASHRCLRGSRVPFRHASTTWSSWDDGAGLGLIDLGAGQ